MWFTSKQQIKELKQTIKELEGKNKFMLNAIEVLEYEKLKLHSLMKEYYDENVKHKEHVASLLSNLEIKEKNIKDLIQVIKELEEKLDWFYDAE